MATDVYEILDITIDLFIYNFKEGTMEDAKERTFRQVADLISKELLHRSKEVKKLKVYRAPVREETEEEYRSVFQDEERDDG